MKRLVLLLLFPLTVFAESNSNLDAYPDRWASNMTRFGEDHCNQSDIQASCCGYEPNVWYYDGGYVYFQIADYTGDSSWNTCAGYVIDAYRTYVLNNVVPGWRVFPHGLYEDWVRNGSTQSMNAVCRLANNSAWATSYGGADVSLSRETAYLLQAALYADKVGSACGDQSVRIDTTVSYAKGHLDKWPNWKSLGINPGYVQVFMMALTAHALIEYDREYPGDSTILTKIQTVFDWLWSSAAMDDGTALLGSTNLGTSFYKSADSSDSENSSTSPDLNLLVAPIYFWLCKETGTTTYCDKGDELVEGGVTVIVTYNDWATYYMPSCSDSIEGQWCTGAYLFTGKVFSQNYRVSFTGFDWREQAVGSVPTSTPSATPTASNTPTSTNTPAPTNTPGGPTPTPTPTPTVTPTPTPVGVTVARVNCGGGEYLDGSGNTWDQDTYYVEGYFYTTEDAISGTTDDTLYQSEAVYDPLQYEIPIDPGTYDVLVKYAENSWPETGDRVFDVTIEGTLVDDDLDIYATAGHDAALDKTYSEIEVSDGTMNIVFDASANYGKCSAIQIVESTLPTPTPTPTPTVTPTPTNTPTPGVLRFSCTQE